VVLEGNPIVGYSKLKDGVRLLFWSGQSFNTPGLARRKGSSRPRRPGIHPSTRWTRNCWAAGWGIPDIQWDYKNIVRRKGVLERLR
jgi:hypothetical protein